MGSVSFLTPLATLVAVVGIFPLAMFLGRQRRARRVRETLGLAQPDPGADRRLLAALIAVPALAALAAAQPVIDRSTPLQERADAEVFFVVDSSRSMLAAAGPDEPTRFERARMVALRVRQRLPEIPAGLAQMTDWTLPHLFATSDSSTFRLTLSRSISPGGPAIGGPILATDLSALTAFARASFFSPGTRHRLLVVLTDGETRTVKPRLAVLRRAGIRTLFVHFWGADESIWRPEGAEPQYRPDPTSKQQLARVATLVDGTVFEEDDVTGVVSRARTELGEGPTRPRSQRDLLALMPYATLAAIVPLAAILRRRNL